MGELYKDTREFDYKFGYAETVSAEDVDSLDGTYHSHIKGIIKEVISNPIKWGELKDEEGITNKEKYTYLFQKPNEENRIDSEINNYDLIDVMPPNSVICYIPEGKGPRSMSGRTIVAFPFFPSHISIPAKPGEHIWLLKESVNKLSTGYSFYYWMCKVTTYRQVDDINYTFLPQHERVFEGIKNQKATPGLQRISSADAAIITSYQENTNKELPLEASNSSIIASSTSYRQEFTMEPVPRKFKNCGDLLLQGSNNSHLHLTTEKFNKSYLDDTSKQNLFTNPAIPNNVGNFNNPVAGAMDIAVGRDKKRIKELVALSQAGTKSPTGGDNFGAVLGSRPDGFQSFEGYTLDKINESCNEDDDTPRNAFSRLYMTMDGDVDKDFEIKEDLDFAYQKGASLVGYSDHIRMFSEKTLRLANVNSVAEETFGMIEIDNSGQITLQAGKSDTGAKIILRPNGNIILKPGPKGLLHLGGDESDTTLSVCGVPTSIDAENGTATPEPIKSSLGGELFRGGNPDSETLNFPALSEADVGLLSAGIGALAANAASGTPIPPGTFPVSVTDQAAGLELAPDGTASSKVVIKA